MQGKTTAVGVGSVSAYPHIRSCLLKNGYHRFQGCIIVPSIDYTYIQFMLLSSRRIQKFKQNRLGYISLWLFLSLFLISLVAEFVANDRPFLVVYQGQWYAPVFVDYPETTFGGDFATPTDYHDEYVQELIAANGWALWPLIPFSHDTVDYQLNAPPPTYPDHRHWLGTDDQGRDVLARILYGFRLSVLFGLALTALGSLIGVMVGAVQGYYGGWVDLAGQRTIEVWNGLPELYILIVLSSLLVPGVWTLLLIMMLFSWTRLVGVVRAEFLRVRNFEYVKAARAMGVGDVTIMRRHILPNAMVATLTFLPFILNGSIVTLASLDFLGLGLPPGSPSLGELVAQGKANLQAPWLGLSAFISLSLLLSLLIFIGEAVRDAFAVKV